MTDRISFPGAKRVTLRSITIALAALALGACATAGRPSQRMVDAMVIGKVMYMHDVWAARASDAVLAQLPADAEALSGWVTEEMNGAGTVTFPSADRTTARYRVSFREQVGAPVVEALPAGTVLTETQRAMVAARDAAFKTRFRPCSRHYNAIVLPASLLRKQGWLVYLTPGGTEPGVIRVGGHYRVHVSADGREVQSVTPFSKSCLILTKPEDAGNGFQVEGVAVSHLLGDTPTESHMFLSLLHRLDMVVITETSVWKLFGGNVALLE